MNVLFILICSCFLSTAFAMDGGDVDTADSIEGDGLSDGKRRLSGASEASSDSVGDERPAPAKKQNIAPFDVDSFFADPHFMNSGKKYTVILSSDLREALEAADPDIMPKFLERFKKATEARLSDKVEGYSFFLHEGDVIGQNILGKNARR